jgi:hypothetical protein
VFSSILRQDDDDEHPMTSWFRNPDRLVWRVFSFLARSLLYGAFLFGVDWVSCGWPLSRIWVPVIAALLLVTVDFFLFTLPRPRGLAAAQAEQRGWLTGFWTLSDVRGVCARSLF